jgi:TolA-binding protein
MRVGWPVVEIALSMLAACGGRPSAPGTAAPGRSSSPEVVSQQGKPQGDRTADLEESEWAILDKRESRTRTRELEMVVREIKGLEGQFFSLNEDSKDRPMLLRQLAEDYVELAFAAQRDVAAATAIGDLAGAASRKVTLARSRRGAINFYLLLVNEYGGKTSPRFRDNPPPVYADLDEAKYYLAVEYYVSEDAPRTRRVLLDLVEDNPTSKFAGRAYVLFGEMFASEVPGDRTKYRPARLAFSRAASPLLSRT